MNQGLNQSNNDGATQTYDNQDPGQREIDGERCIWTKRTVNTLASIRIIETFLKLFTESDDGDSSFHF